jgi:hypothetical protein
MVCKFIENNALVRHFKAHWLYYFVASDFVWVTSNFMTTPVITAIAVVFLVYGVIAILLDALIPQKAIRWVMYFSLLAVCILITHAFWSKLVYACDKDNPYKKLLITGTATIEVVIDSNSEDFEIWGGSEIALVRKNQNILVMFTPTTTESYAQKIGNNEICYRATINLNANDKSVGKPISDLTNAEYVKIHFQNMPQNSKVTRGVVTFIFNNLPIRIPIPAQTIDNVIIIKDIQKDLLGKRL